jgi:hypothetical protein
MERRTYRTTPGAYLVSATLTATLCVMWALAVWRLEAPWQPLLVPLAAFALVALWLSRFRLTIGEGEIRLAAPFQGARRLALHDVISIEFGSESGRTQSPFVLCIRTSDGEELRFDAKVFSTEAVQQLLALAPQSKRPR